MELILLAGKVNKEGALPSVHRIAWTLRSPEEGVLADLKSLAEVGVVSEVEPGSWVVTHFKERQNCESTERVRRYRERYSNGKGNGGVTGAISTSGPRVPSGTFRGGGAALYGLEKSK